VATALPKPVQDLPATKTRIGSGWMRRFEEVGVSPHEIYRDFASPDLDEAEKREVSAMRHYFMGQYYLTMGEAAHALGEFRAALEETPDQPAVKMGIVEAAVEKKDYDEALRVAGEVLAGDPGNVQAMIFKARICMDRAQDSAGRQRRDQIDQAITAFEEARKIQPKNLEVLNGLASAYVAVQDVDKMVATYREILQADPRNTRAMLILGQILSRTGKPDEAIAYYEKVIEQRRGFVNTYVYLGQLQDELGRTDQAIATYKAAVLVEPRNQQLVKLFDDAARKAAGAKGGKPAIRHYEDFAREYPYSGDVQRLYAEQLAGAKDWDRAVRQYKRVLELDSENVDAMVALGNILMEQKEFDEAARQFAHAVEINPEKVDVYDSIAASFLNRKERAKAVEVYERAIRLNPKVERLYVSLAALYDEDGKPGDAIRALELGAERCGQKPELLFPLGQVYEKAGNTGAALEYYTKAFELSPDNRLLLVKLVSSLVRADRTAEIDGVLARASESFKEDKSDLYLIVGETFLTEGETSAAASLFRRAITAQPSKLVSYARLTRALNLRGEHDESIAVLEKASDVFRNSEEVQRLKAETLLDGKDYDKALDIYRSLLAAKPDALDGYRLLVDALNKAERFDDAAGVVKQAEQRLGRTEEVESLRGVAQYQRKSFDAAEKTFKELARRNSKNADTYNYFLGSIYLEQKRHDLARKSFEKAIELNPTNDSALNALGYMLADQDKDLPLAQKYVEQALALNPGAPHILDSLGWVYFRMGKPDKAREYVERAAALMGDDPEIYDHLGDIYRAQGDMRRAVEYWRKSFALDGKRVSVKAKIDAHEPKLNKE
jgi:tetratricopeptide (TPR) repeat protein